MATTPLMALQLALQQGAASGNMRPAVPWQLYNQMLAQQST